MKTSAHVGLALVVVLGFAVVDRYFARASDAPLKAPSAVAGTLLTLKPFRLPVIGPLKGSEMTLQSLKGRRTFIEFWASWCESCRQERPLLNKLRSEHPHASMLAVATLDDEASVRKSEADNPHGYPVLLDAQGLVAQGIGIEAIPQSLIIDDQGKVLRHFKGPLKEIDLKEIANFLN